MWSNAYKQQIQKTLITEISAIRESRQNLNMEDTFKIRRMLGPGINASQLITYRITENASSYQVETGPDFHQLCFCLMQCDSLPSLGCSLISSGSVCCLAPPSKPGLLGDVPQGNS